jgi:2-polyprenyl-6-methoxyphenol hydroxylase-like FAD-dependent oxidoreductase
VQDDSEPVQARILIGADGYFSKVRECMLGDGPPVLIETVMSPPRALKLRNVMSGNVFADAFYHFPGAG